MAKEITGSKAFSKRFKTAMDAVWGKNRDNPMPYRRRR